MGFRTRHLTKPQAALNPKEEPPASEKDTSCKKEHQVKARKEVQHRTTNVPRKPETRSTEQDVSTREEKPKDRVANGKDGPDKETSKPVASTPKCRGWIRGGTLMVTDPATTSKLQSTGKLPPEVGSKPPNQPEEKVEEVVQSKTQKVTPKC